MPNVPYSILPNCNARLWIHHIDGFVKLTLKPNKPLSVNVSRWNGEGWSHEASTYILENNIVFDIWEHSGNDCDGNHQSSGIQSCSIDRLKSWVFADLDDGSQLPTWEKAGPTVCRDQFAELMGY